MVYFINDEELEVIQPGQVPAILVDHRRRLVYLEKWIEKQNGSLRNLGEEVKQLREDMHSGNDALRAEMNKGFGELKDLYYESREKATQGDQQVNKERDSKIGQRIGWGFTALAILISIGALVVNLTK